MTNQPSHPAQRFTAPSHIRRGVPLKNLMGLRLVRLIGQSLAGIVTGFDERRFRREASRDLAGLELKERAASIARAMAGQMPASFADLVPLLIESLGPPLERTEGNGRAPFFYLPHSELIAAHGASSFASGMAANYEITKRFTAEFSIRPLLVRHRSKCLRVLSRWARDEDPHVRRLVSEGTRPRLPWAMRLAEFQANPNLALPLLETLKEDRDQYVQRSVANHLGDIAKDHLGLALEICDRWLREAQNADDATAAANRRWIVRHALRHPAAMGNGRAIAIRKHASAAGGPGR